jgi:hypothetical protein
MMADLIDLNDYRPRGTLPLRVSAATGSRDAKVLFFTGVRYERVEGASGAPTDALDNGNRLDGTPRGSRGKGKRRA